MKGYKRTELVKLPNLINSFSSFIEKLKTQSLEKIAIIDRDNIEAIILSKDEYETLKEQAEFNEHKEIYDIVNSRKNLDPEKATNLDDIIQKNNLEDEI